MDLAVQENIKIINIGAYGAQNEYVKAKAVKFGLLHGQKRGRDWFLRKDRVFGAC